MTPERIGFTSQGVFKSNVTYNQRKTRFKLKQCYLLGFLMKGLVKTIEKESKYFFRSKKYLPWGV